MGRESALDTREEAHQEECGGEDDVHRTGIFLDRLPAAKPPRQKNAIQMVKVRELRLAPRRKSAPMGAAKMLQPYTNPAKRGAPQGPLRRRESARRSVLNSSAPLRALHPCKGIDRFLTPQDAERAVDQGLHLVLAGDDFHGRDEGDPPRSRR